VGAGVQIHVVSQWEPSSKTCSGGGRYHQDLQLRDRVFHFQDCGLVIDGDLNAARNQTYLAEMFLDSLSTVSYTGMDACEMGSAGSMGNRRVKLPTAKQEPNADYGRSIKG